MTPTKPTKPKTGHTPLPWMVSGLDSRLIVADMGQDPYDGLPRTGTVARVAERTGETDANVEFICRAANCHDELVAALKEYLDWHEANFALPGGNFEDPDQMTIARTARAALARAEGREG